MEEENPIYKKSLEKEENIIPKNNNINIQNIQHKSSIVISRAQIYHYEKTIHDLTLQNNDMNELIENKKVKKVSAVSLSKFIAMIDNAIELRFPVSYFLNSSLNFLIFSVFRICDLKIYAIFTPFCFYTLRHFYAISSFTFELPYC